MSLDSHIILEPGGLAKIDLVIPALAKYHQFVLLSHPRLKQLYGASIVRSLKKFGRPVIEICVPEGESSKALEQASSCWQQMFAEGVERQAAFIALGGGVICDLGGFVASCYMRGLDTFYLPTTLLAMVDAAFGGKTGINFQNIKNGIGTFHAPQQILIDLETLLSLPSREFNSGLAEIIKYGMIGDPLLFEELEENVEKLGDCRGIYLESIIRRCVALKRAVVKEDGKEDKDCRVILNYGHTFGHAIEVVSNGQLLHGEAVAIGMSCAAHLSAQMGLCSQVLVGRQDRLCQRAHLPIHLADGSVDCLITRMKNDKKRFSGKISLILPERIGKVIRIYDVDPALIKHILLAKIKQVS